MVSRSDKRQRIMSNNSHPTHPNSEPIVYQIRLRGHIAPRWTDWFEGMCISLEDTGDTLLTGPLPDQSALHGLFKKVRDAGMPLLSVNPVAPHQATCRCSNQKTEYQ